MYISEKIFPPASILKKIVDIDSNAGQWIMDRLAEVGDIRRKRELRENALTRKAAFKLMLEGAASLGSIFSRVTPKVPFSKADHLDPDQAMFKNLLVIGNDLRTAIRDYCDQNPQIKKAAQLTEQDWCDLQPISAVFGSDFIEIRYSELSQSTSQKPEFTKLSFA